MTQNDFDSSLNKLIPGEIKNDHFYRAIQKIASRDDINNILEIGSSSGEGSTEAFVSAIRQSPNKPMLFCMEVSQTRFQSLQERYANYEFVKCYHVSSVPIQDFPSESEIVNFYQNQHSNLNFYPLPTVLSWYYQDLEYIRNSQVEENGIQIIKNDNNIDFFDVVLIDGSEFTGIAELKEIYGAKFILLDDIRTFKNYHNHQQLLQDKNYKLIAENPNLRNGYSIFEKQVDGNAVSLTQVQSSSNLPIHFFTIILNGEPFIRYHINVLSQLPCEWHWHIIEGVAELKHDTAWSLRNGGKISDTLHQNGRSYDGTSDYLDELKANYPDQITIYRKPEGMFWDGKREMVNAPLGNIQEECLLWQLDVDEFWTVEQIYQARQMFIDDPNKTSAFYWCWYFVGKNLVISTRNCYTQNPRQDWLRTWRFKPGYIWLTHEPPQLVEPLPDNQFNFIGSLNPFSHQETEEKGLVFQHFAYFLPEQLKFKEQYYGYQNALAEWEKLQQQAQFPVFLKDYFSWVQDYTQVETAESLGIKPILQEEIESQSWKFVTPQNQPTRNVKLDKASPIILIDGVFFQLYKTGIARVWQSLLEEWALTDFRQHIIVLDRANTAPKIAGLSYCLIPAYDYGNTEADREMLQEVCNAENADLFISSYYTTPLSTPSVFMAYDMIPEILGGDLESAMWREKHYGIRHASSYIAISQNTAHDLVKFFPDINPELITVAHCGVSSLFKPASPEEIEKFKHKYGIHKPYFLLVGAGSSTSNYKNGILFFKGFSQLPSKQGFEIVCTGSGVVLSPEFREYTQGTVVHLLSLSDSELRLAYAGALALVYPSKYEGFGMPIAEAMACGCPVITCPNASIPEVAGEATLYVNDTNVDELTNALCEIQKPTVRQTLISEGFKQVQQFSWFQMASTISLHLIQSTLLHLNLRAINLIIFPDWSTEPENLGQDLARVIQAISKSSQGSSMTLLIDTLGTNAETANLLVSNVIINFLISESEEDIEQEPEISFLGQLTELEWQALLPKINYCIKLQYENQTEIQKWITKYHVSVITLEQLIKI